MAAALEELLADDRLRRRLSAAARRTIAAHFSLERNSRLLAALYRRSLAAIPRAA